MPSASSRVYAYTSGLIALLRAEDVAHGPTPWREVLTGGRSGPSLVDWAGFLTMRGEGIETAVAVDGHFRAQGFRVLPG